MKVVIVCDGADRADAISLTVTDALGDPKLGEINFMSDKDIYHKQFGFMEPTEAVIVLIEPDIDGKIDRKLMASRMVCHLNFLNSQIFIVSPR